MSSLDLLVELQRWYERACDGEWEHSYGVNIGTLDNPGWSLKIDLKGTPLQGRSFSQIEHLEPERDWYICSVEQDQFRGYGGPQELSRLIATFLAWANSPSPS